jgi:hypothetical protein
VRNKYIWIVLSVAVAMVAVVVVVFVGNPDGPPGPPESTYSYTLEDIYRRLDTGAAGTPITFTEPISGPGTGTMHTLDDIMDVAPAVDDTNGATQAQVLEGTTAWGLTSGQWGVMTGTMPDNGGVVMVPSTVTQAIAMGYHDGSGHVVGDTDLVSGNVRSGVSLFGVSGDSNVVDTSSGDAVAGEILTGKKAWVDGVEVSGARYGGCTCAGTLDGTRWCDNGDGTVTDLTTCLVWLKNANCIEDLAGITKSPGNLTWTDAVIWSSVVVSGTCGLSDGSVEGDWWLPTRSQLYVLTHGTEPVRSGTPRAFTGVQSDDYWSSTTYADITSGAWLVYLGSGGVIYDAKTRSIYVWPVCGGQ